MQPSNSNGAQPHRVSRLDSTASECDEKKGSFKRNVPNGGGGGGAEVTACPIYASIGENLDKEAATNDYVNNTHKFHRVGSGVKPLKKG